MKSRSLVLLSGESTTLPEAEARALFLSEDPESSFEVRERRVLLVESSADPFKLSRRIAFARRVGVLLDEAKDAASVVRGKRVRVRAFNLTTEGTRVTEETVLNGLDCEVDLEDPDYEFTAVHGHRDYLAITSPRGMSQGWYARRPRGRAFFHPSAIFPKLARALVNLSACAPGDTFLDPFCGTGSLPIEASVIGARVIAADQSQSMASGALANMKHFRQNWLGVLRGDAFCLPLRRIDAVATDVPYGRASSARGRDPHGIVRETLASIAPLLRPGGRMVIMHPKEEQVPPTGDLQIESEHFLYVHIRLTRAITVMRKK